MALSTSALPSDLLPRVPSDQPAHAAHSSCGISLKLGSSFPLTLQFRITFMPLLGYRHTLSHLINTYEVGDKQTQPQQNLLPGARCYTSRLHPPPPPLSPVCAPSSVSCKRAVLFGFAEVIWPPLTSLPVPSPSSPLTPRSGPCSSPGRQRFLSLNLITYQQTSALSLEPSSSCHLFQEVFFCPPRVCEGH